MRHELILQRMDAAILVVDVQERLLKEVVQPEKVVKNIVKLVRAAKILNVPIVVTEHNPKIFGATASPILDALGDCKPISKMIFSCFGERAFVDAIDNLDKSQLIVAGLETHICVCQTALDAIADDLDTHVLFDAVTARSEENHRIGLEKMKEGGVIPSSTEIAIFDLMEQAGTDTFRKILPLLKET